MLMNKRQSEKVSNEISGYIQDIMLSVWTIR